MAKKKRKKVKRKLNKKRFFMFLIFLSLFCIFLYYIFNVNIKNIYIKGNNYLTDQEIIDIAKISDYPNSIKNLSVTIKDNLTKNKYILTCSVRKNILLNKVYIKVKENYPLFYYEPENKIVLYNGEKTDELEPIVTVINKIPDVIYKKFLKIMQNIDINVIYRMSQIEYKPNDVDDERFFILMNDGNYVYLTLNKGLSINKYFDIIKSFDNKKGILYLDSGEYFDLFDK